MRKLIEAAVARMGAKESISKRLQLSFRVLIGLLILPALVSLVLMLRTSLNYQSVIEQAVRVSSLKPVVDTQLPDEMFYIVAGHKTFDEGNQYEMIHWINDEIASMMRSAHSDSVKELDVARRTMKTLETYIDQMGEIMRDERPVAEGEALLEEVRNVSTLVADMLADYADSEISAAQLASRQMQRTIWLVAAGLAALLALTLLFSLIAQKSLVHTIEAPISQLKQFAGEIAAGNLTTRAPETRVTELRELTDSLNTMAGRLQYLIDENRAEQENLKKSELKALQAQINPHFLYNTLDAIVWLAEAEETHEVIRVTRALSDFFRISLNQGRDWISLADEIRHLTGYLMIQKIRYRDILDYRIDIPEALHDTQVLKLMLQPLVENALYHGIKHRRGRGMICVTGRGEGDYLILSVQDNGAGMSPERLAQVREGLLRESGEDTGYGLYNVHKRIQLYYNQPQGIRIESSETGGTTVSLRVPVRRG